MSLADIHNIFLAEDRANSPTPAEMLRQHYGLPALAELNKASKRFGSDSLIEKKWYLEVWNNDVFAL